MSSNGERAKPTGADRIRAAPESGTAEALEALARVYDALLEGAPPASSFADVERFIAQLALSVHKYFPEDLDEDYAMKCMAEAADAAFLETSFEDGRDIWAILKDPEGCLAKHAHDDARAENDAHAKNANFKHKRNKASDRNASKGDKEPKKSKEKKGARERAAARLAESVKKISAADAAQRERVLWRAAVGVGKDIACGFIKRDVARNQLFAAATEAGVHEIIAEHHINERFDNAARKHAWRKGLLLNKDGHARASIANVIHALRLHPAWQGVLVFDQFRNRVRLQSAPPMREVDRPQNYAPGEWGEADTTRTTAWIAAELGFDPSPSTVEAAVVTVAQAHLVHPIRDWLEGLKWDGKPRLDDLLPRYFGAENSAYARAVGAKFQISAVARVYQPGSKVDTMPILEGPQGEGKSRGLRALCGAEWFADSGINLYDKDSYQGLTGVWIYELAELSAFKGRDVERIKAFLSSQIDHYRPSYGRHFQDVPRQVVFAGTTNAAQYLTDDTGSRRFWPVRVGQILDEVDVEAIERDREQLWAEAVQRYRDGEKWYLDTPELVHIAAIEAEQREEVDPWQERIELYLARKLPNHPLREPITSDSLLAVLEVRPEHRDRAGSLRVGAIMRRLGYKLSQMRVVGSVVGSKDRVRRFVRDDGVSHKSEPAGEKCDEKCAGKCDNATQRKQSGSGSKSPSVTLVTQESERSSGESDRHRNGQSTARQKVRTDERDKRDKRDSGGAR